MVDRSPAIAQQLDGVTYRQRSVVPNATLRLGFRF